MEVNLRGKSSIWFSQMWLRRPPRLISYICRFIYGNDCLVPDLGKFGLIFTTRFLDYFQNYKIDDNLKNSFVFCKCTKITTPYNLPLFQVRIEPIPDEMYHDEDYNGKARVSVPITLCMVILVGYISGGAVLFSLWEGWGFLDGSYFCFVTLSTIGKALSERRL